MTNGPTIRRANQHYQCDHCPQLIAPGDAYSYAYHEEHGPVHVCAKCIERAVAA